MKTIYPAFSLSCPTHFIFAFKHKLPFHFPSLLEITLSDFFNENVKTEIKADINKCLQCRQLQSQSNMMIWQHNMTDTVAWSTFSVKISPV